MSSSILTENCLVLQVLQRKGLQSLQKDQMGPEILKNVKTTEFIAFWRSKTDDNSHTSKQIPNQNTNLLNVSVH